MLLLPTGVGGVLYRPRYFHPVVFDTQFRNITKVGDDIMFRMATMIQGIRVRDEGVSMIMFIPL